ncbi:unnamed protein product [Rhizophagus irregularis]|nr:unnamed protein product [Rhizophagus irregularis]
MFRLTYSFRSLSKSPNLLKLRYPILKFYTMEPTTSASKHKLSGEEPTTKRIKVSPHECDTCYKCLNEKFCKSCFEHHYEKTQKDFSSGNETLDNLVKYIRYSEDDNISFLQWIPFDRLKDVTYLTKGGGGTTSTATWLDGKYVRWSHDEKRWIRTGETRVAIKTLKDSQSKLDDYVAGLDEYFKCASQYHITYYGISQETATSDYSIIMEYADPGDLRQFLAANKFKLYWRRKLELIRDVISGLEIIHDSGITHRNLHTGNILKVKNVFVNARINDLGLYTPNIASGEIQVRLKEKIYEWLLVLGWFPTSSSREHSETSQFEAADDAKNKNDKSYSGAIYSQTITPQTPVYTSRKFKRHEITPEIAGGSASISLFIPEEPEESEELEELEEAEEPEELEESKEFEEPEDDKDNQ